MKVYVSNGYDRLKSCLLCYPINYRITNKSNKFYNGKKKCVTYFGER